MAPTYAGPVRDEPLAVELHNTIYVAHGAVADGLAGEASLAAWLRAVADRLPAGARGADPARLPDVLALRDAVGAALRAAADGRRVPAAALRAINDAAARAPRSPALAQRRDGELRAIVDHHGADAADVVLAAMAADAVELLAGPRRADLRVCGAPACVLMFVKDHPRRAWCSASCGNRARQARHYRRTHAAD
jgi:predicted RNA-binding Zn ribbon-like protein